VGTKAGRKSETTTKTWDSETAVGRMMIHSQRELSRGVFPRPGSMSAFDHPWAGYRKDIPVNSERVPLCRDEKVCAVCKARATWLESHPAQEGQ
jgi:hypothetical protein